jgi:hypothetical protein
MKFLTLETWAFKLLSLIPIIANGIHATKQDATLGDKTTAAQDALATAAVSAQVLLPADQQPLAASIASVASQAIAGTVQALHNAGKPATA